MKNIEIYCSLSEDCDEKGEGGLWDLAGELALIAGQKTSAQDKPLYAEDFGQEEIYNKLRSLVKPNFKEE